MISKIKNIIKIFIDMGQHKIKVIEQNDIWFADFTETELTPTINGVNQKHLKKINLGTPLMEILSEGTNNFLITLSDTPIPNCYEFKILDKPTNGKEIWCLLENYKNEVYNLEFLWCFESLFFIFGKIPTPSDFIYFVKHD